MHIFHKLFTAFLSFPLLPSLWIFDSTRMHSPHRAEPQVKGCNGSPRGLVRLSREILGQGCLALLECWDCFDRKPFRVRQNSVYPAEQIHAVPMVSRWLDMVPPSQTQTSCVRTWITATVRSLNSPLRCPVVSVVTSARRHLLWFRSGAIP